VAVKSSSSPLSHLAKGRQGQGVVVGERVMLERRAPRRIWLGVAYRRVGRKKMYGYPFLRN
jgi:hypothetical protein